MRYLGTIDFDDRPEHDNFELATSVELTTVSGYLQSNINSKSDTSHLHDDRYYTESEVDDLITTASGLGDVYADANINANAIVIGDDGAKGVKAGSFTDVNLILSNQIFS